MFIVKYAQSVVEAHIGSLSRYLLRIYYMLGILLVYDDTEIKWPSPWRWRVLIMFETGNSH